jgi:hypothetical protein
MAEESELDDVTKVLSMYKNIKNELKTESKLDYIAAILAAGMLLDLKGGDEEPLNLATMIRVIKAKVSELSDGIITPNDISMAKLVSSYVALSPKLEKPEEIIDIWDKLRKEVELSDDLDFVMALLISSRTHGVTTPDGMEEVEDILKKLMK